MNDLGVCHAQAPFFGVWMIGLLQLIGVLSLVCAGIAVMIGALEPGEAFRRVGAVLLLVFLVPALIQVLIRAAVAPFLAEAVTDLVRAAVILGIIAVVTLIGWLALRLFSARRARNQDGGDL
ncbi:MAG: hypothetical protein ACRD3Q_04450 [Terriglobales bacterium]